jgi:adenylate cyclase
MTTTRRLAAIMAADVAGFSAAMERDEEGTFALVQELRRKIIEPKIAEHLGRLVKTTGDGFLVEFASPIAAMKCALAIQADLAGRPLQLRIGLNLGDVIVEESGDVYGEGVNVAARLEALADPGGILISGKVHSEVEGKVDAAFEDRGEKQVKNIIRPVHAYSARIAIGKSAGVVAKSSALKESGALSLPDKPSIAVLPFQNMSGNPEQEYFADGLVEDILTELSRFKSLFVIARNSTFVYKGKPVDIKQVGRDLGVRYVLEGSVRKAAGRIRITGQLVDGATGGHVWAERFDGSDQDIFDLQDQVTARVVATIGPQIELAEIERVRRKPTESLTAYDKYLRALSGIYAGTKASTDEAMALLYAAIDDDPEFALAYGLLALCYVRRKASAWMINIEREIAETSRVAGKAAAFGKHDALALSAAGYSLAFVVGDAESGESFTDQAIELNSNLAWAWLFGGWVKLFRGEGEIAIERVTRAMRLSPNDPQTFNMQSAIACAHLFASRYEDARQWSAMAIKSWPGHVASHCVQVASNAFLGNATEAHQALDKLSELVPNFLASQLDTIVPLLRPVDLELWRAGLLKAGIPE